MDSEHIKDEPRQRPFGPPPETSTSSVVTILCIVVCSMILLYRAADWWQEQGTAKPATKQQQTEQPKQADQAHEAAKLGPVPRPLPPPTPLPEYQEVPNKHAVTKCITNGKTSYGDHACDKDAIQSKVIARPDHNLMAAVQIPPENRQPEPVQQQIAVTPNNEDPTLTSNKYLCQAMEAKIARLDVIAREPHTAQTQDWIRAERKKLRDEQFRLPCR